MDRYDKHFLFNFAFDPVLEEAGCNRISCICQNSVKRFLDDQCISTFKGGVGNGYFDVSTKRIHNDASPNS